MNVQSKLRYNPKYEYTYDTAELVVKKLQKMGYKARCIMGISQMKIASESPQHILNRVLGEVWDEEILKKHQKK